VIFLQHEIPAHAKVESRTPTWGFLGRTGWPPTKGALHIYLKDFGENLGIRACLLRRHIPSRGTCGGVMVVAQKFCATPLPKISLQTGQLKCCSCGLLKLTNQ